MPAKLTAKSTLLYIFTSFLLIYSLFQAHKIITGPQVDVFTPTNGITVSTSLMIVTGKAENVSILTLNGRKIFTDNTGAFSEKLLLSPGYNTIVIEGKDKFGTVQRKVLAVILKE